MSKRRIEWIDIAKGMGMLLVIFGHALPYGSIPCNLIFAFHMPLFFILSGMVYKEVTIKELLVKRSHSLLLPYILFCILGILIALIMRELSINAIIADMYYGNPEHIYVSSVWFLVALFGVVLLFSFIRKIKKKNLQYAVLIFFIGIGFVYGYLYTHGRLNLRLPLDLDVVPMAVGFFAFGFYMKTYLINITEKFKNSNILISVSAIFVVGLLFVGVAILNHSVNLHGITYHNPIFYIIESLLGSLVLILFCCRIEERMVVKPLIWIGKNTIYLLGFQAIGIRLSIVAINSVFGKEYSLYGLSYLYGFIAFIITTMFSILLTILTKTVWSNIYKKGVKEN